MIFVETYRVQAVDATDSGGSARKLCAELHHVGIEGHVVGTHKTGNGSDQAACDDIGMPAPAAVSPSR